MMHISGSVPGTSVVGCWTRDIAVPWKESRAIVELGLWSILSPPAVVKKPL